MGTPLHEPVILASFRPATPQDKTLLSMTITPSEVSTSFQMEVPVDVYWKGSPVPIGFITIKGPDTATASVPPPVHPSKVATDTDHALLAIEKR